MLVDLELEGHRFVRAPLQHVAIVIPAHNEAKTIYRSISSIVTALADQTVSYLPHTVVVVADACDDDTVDQASRLLASGNVVILQIDARNAGIARHTGFHYVLETLSDLQPEEIWCATTDADSEVPRNWLERQLHWRAVGFHAIAGKVTVGDWDCSQPQLRRRYLELMEELRNRDDHVDVYGANMSFSGSAYRSIGGFRPFTSGEDRDLWERLSSSGLHTLSASDLKVTTSSRLDPRAPNGFGALLQKLSQDETVVLDVVQDAAIATVRS